MKSFRDRIMVLGAMGLSLMLLIGGGSSVWGQADEVDSPAVVSEDMGETAVVEVTPTEEVPAGVGHLVVDNEILDLGTVEPGQRVTGEFTLTNDGDAPLEFEGQPGHSCGCTVPHLDSLVLQPGESTTLSLVYTAQTSPGRVSKKLWVLVQPPAQPRRLEMHIQANIRRLIEAAPSSWQFELRDTPGNSVPLVLRSLDGIPFRVTGCTVTGEIVSVEFDPAVSAVQHELPITIDIQRLRGVSMGSVTLTTDHVGAESVTIPFQVTMPFTAAPPRRFFRDIEAGRGEPAAISIVSNYGEEFELGAIVSERGLVTVDSIESTVGGYIVNVIFTPPADASTRLVRDTLRVEIVDHPEDTIEILFYGRADRTDQ
ncbi:MAG: DUF1573 domain-containing protein [Sedimentisphaerales bacterium]|nr:DUF1573 domain-containing protein [Sedimentisphaerales bacterium]